MSTPSNTGSTHDDDNGGMDIDDLSRLCGMGRNEILEFSRLRFVSLQSSGGRIRADVHTLRRLRHICTLRDDHEMNVPAIGYVLGLMDRLEAAEHELRILRERL